MGERAAAQREVGRQAAQADASGEHGAQQHGQVGYALAFLTGKIGLGAHVLVALHRCLTPSQVGRVVAAFRAGAPLARELDVGGRSPKQVVNDERFGWTAAPMRAHLVSVPPVTPVIDEGLVDKLTKAVVEELNGDASPKVLLQALEVARHNNVVAALYARLRGAPHKRHGNCFYALLSLTGVEGNLSLVDELARAVIEEVNGDASAKVLLQAVEVARHNHIAPALCDQLRKTRHEHHGNCFNALLTLTGVEGSAALEHIMESTLDKAGVDVAADPAIAALDAHAKLARAAKYGGGDMLGEVAQQLIAMLPALAAFWAASHLTVAGFALDLLGYALMGAQLAQAIEDLLAFYTMATEARTDADLREAGARLAKAIATIGIAGVCALIAWARGRGRGGIEARKVTDGGRVTDLVPGHAESVDRAVPEGWTVIYEGRDRTPPGIIRFRTEVTDPAGNKSVFVRVYDSAEKLLRMDYAFLHPESPSRVKHPGTMLTPEGTPTQSFWTTRQIRRMGLVPSDVEHVKMSSIQNLRTMLQVARAKRDGIDPATMLETTASYQYASTPLTQVGNKPIPGTVKMSGGEPYEIGTLMRHQENNELADRAANDALLREFDFTRTDWIDFAFDLTFDVECGAKSRVLP